MSLRQKLLLLALITLVLPVSGWLLLRELEGFLRAGQQQALQASAATMARSIQNSMEDLASVRVDAKARNVVVSSGQGIVVDGYFSEWPSAADNWHKFTSADQQLKLELAARSNGRQLWLALRVADSTPVRENLAIAGAMDGLELSLFGAQGMTSFRVVSAGSGPLTLNSNQQSQLNGYWLDSASGYRIELVLPLAMATAGLRLRIVDVDNPQVRIISRQIQTPRMALLLYQTELESRLKEMSGQTQSIWLLDLAGNVRARVSPALGAQTEPHTASWIERLFHTFLVKPLPDAAAIAVGQLQLQDSISRAALQGESVGHWSRRAGTAEMINTVAVPVQVAGKVVGALRLEQGSDELLLLSNRALGRVVGISLLAMLVIMLAMYLFAGRLSARVRRLNRAVRQASAQPGQISQLPLQQDSDELGELARSHADLLQAVGEYKQYLQTLASKLSHELKTPLVIVRSSLENLARDAGDPRADTYIKRAQEGSDRLASILRAMSDASRLEQAISATDLEYFDLAALLRQSTAAYTQIHPQREIRCKLESEECKLQGVPDLLSQALDKLVDNAVSYTSSADQITLGFRQQQGVVVLYVRNTGSSLPQQMQDKLFESLVSMRAQQRDGTPHLGLGLYLVRLIAEAHKGQVRARNLEDNNGVEFCLEIPGDLDAR